MGFHASFVPIDVLCVVCGEEKFPSGELIVAEVHCALGGIQWPMRQIEIHAADV